MDTKPASVATDDMSTAASAFRRVATSLDMMLMDTRGGMTPEADEKLESLVAGRGGDPEVRSFAESFRCKARKTEIIRAGPARTQGM